MRWWAMAATASVALAGVGTAAWYVHSTRSSIDATVVATVGRSATPARNAEEIATVLENGLTAAVGVHDVRTESTSSGTTLTCSAAAGPSTERVLTVLRAVDASLPGDAEPVDVALQETSDTWTSHARAEDLGQVLGTRHLEPCDEPGPERIMARLDLAKLASYGIELDVLLVTLVRESVPLVVLGNVTVASVSDLEVRASVRLRDVATVAARPAPGRCRSILGGGAMPLQVVRVDASTPQQVVGALRALGADTAPTNRIRVRLPGRSRADDARIAESIVARVPELLGARVSAGGLELFTRLDPERLRARVAAMPDVEWGGTGSGSQVLVAAPADVAGVKARLDAAGAVLAGDSGAPLERTVYEVAPDAALGPWALAVATHDDGTTLFERVDVGVEHPGLDALQNARVRGRPMAELVRAKQTVAPRAVVRLDGRPVTQLDYEGPPAVRVKEVAGPAAAVFPRP